MTDAKSGAAGHVAGRQHHDGIELAPQQHDGRYPSPQQPGLEVAPYSDLEVVSPRPGLSHSYTWEKDSRLPQVAVAAGQPYDGRHAPSDDLGKPYSGGAPSYEYLSPNGPDGGYAPPPPPPPKDGLFRRDAICGVRRQLFWIFMAVGIFVMVAAVAVGVGLGVALHKNGDPAPSASATPLPSANSTTPTTSLPPALATGVTGPAVAIRCPANNQTLYAAAGTNRSYLLLCGRDYATWDGAVDLFNQPMDSMSDCIDECARQQGCVGAGWGNYNNKQVCWLKSKLGDPGFPTTWFFAVEDDGGAEKR